MRNHLVFAVIFLFLLCSSKSSFASDIEVLTVDRTVAKNLQLSFPNDNNIQPDKSEFKIINYVLMSSESGERWVTITLENTSSGTRSLEREHLMGLFANGKRKSPMSYPLSFKGNEIQTFSVSFGESKFPILAVYTSID